jgi:predicted dehydrogenase
MRVAILGMGRWGQAWKRVLEATPGIEVVVGDPGAGGARPDFTEVLAAGDLDAAVVTLPLPLHLAAMTAAVARGIPVLCEKPLVADRDELASLSALDAAADVVIRVNQNYRQRQWARVAREAVASLGGIRRVAISFAQPEFLDGGRAELVHPLLDDMVVHHMDLLRHLTGREACVLGAWSSRIEPTPYAGGTDLDAVLRLAGGGHVSYAGTWAARGAVTPWDADWEIRCEGGTVRVRDLEVTVHRTGETVPTSLPSRAPSQEDADLADSWREFIAAIAGDERAGVSITDNARTMRLVFELRERALSGDVSTSGRHQPDQRECRV